MDDDALVAAAAAAAASCIRTLDFAPWAALLVIPSDGLSPLLFGMPAETAPEYELSTDICDELGFLEPENAAHDDLVDRVDGTDDAAYTLYVSYFYALAGRLRAETGLPVLIHGFGPVEEQLALQQGAAPASTDGLDVLVSLRVAEDRTAVIYRNADGNPRVTGWHGVVAAEPGLGRYKQIGSQPAILAGELPFGVATVELRVGRGPWLHPGATGRGFWLCVLDTPELTRTPELVYRDAEGVEIAIEIPLDSAGVPALWPTQAPPPGPSSAFSPGHSYQLETDGWRVETVHHGDFLPLAQVLLDTPSYLVAQDLGIPDPGLATQPIPGSVLGHRHGFALAAHHGVWAAVANCGTWGVTVQGTGAPPSRLDLHEVPRPR